MADDKALSLNNGSPATRNWAKGKFIGKGAGGGLSDNGYSTSEKPKLAGIAAGTEVNVQADWTVIDTGSDVYIEGKPTPMPADGGNATTVDGHTVAVDVPAGAVSTGAKPVTMKGATTNTIGAVGYASSPAVGAQGKYLRGNGTWQAPPSTTYSAATQSADRLMITTDKKKLGDFQEAASYALRTDIAGVYRYRGGVANEAALPITNISVGGVHSIETKSSYGPAGANVAQISDKTWDNLGGNFTIDFATAAEISAILNAWEGAQDMKALSTDIIATIRDWTKAYVNNNRFNATYLQIDALTGHLQAHQDANLKFTLLSDGYLESEVI